MLFKNNLAYTIIDPNLITQEMINSMRSSVQFSSVNELATSNDGTKVIVKFNLDRADPFVTFQWCTQKEILTELKKAEWQAVVI